ncbi:MAG: carboxylesterase [Methylococcales bacterium]|nr:MAG: carboxylesterase [Methylococcales bacterium]
MHTELTTIEITPKSNHQYSIIWLHGLGADGHDFENIVPELNLKAEPHTHFIFPNAPIQPVTINGGMEMRAWYDILERSLESKVDIDGIYQSATLVEQLIAQEISKGIPSEHILLAGFSQGGVIALQTGLNYPHKLAGIVALSTYFPTLDTLKTQPSIANKTTPIFMGHGILDSVVSIETSKAAYNTLHELQYNVQWHDYVMEHSVCIEEIHHITAFINTAFN